MLLLLSRGTSTLLSGGNCIGGNTIHKHSAFHKYSNNVKHRKKITNFFPNDKSGLTKFPNKSDAEYIETPFIVNINYD